MQSFEDTNSYKPHDVDTRSTVSMQEIEPSPVDDYTSEMENGDYVPKSQSLNPMPEHCSDGGFFVSKLGLRAHRWDSCLSSLQKYSTYPPTLFFALHFFNTSIVPLVTRSVPVSDNYLLLTRPIYQSPGLEHVVLTIPVLAHIASGIALRNIRASRRAQLYGAETSGKSRLLNLWSRANAQARLGYILIPLLGMHALVNRVLPLIVDGGSSGIGLGYVAHGFARCPVFWNIYYLVFVPTGLWHIIGGWAAWMGLRVTTSSSERTNKGSLGNCLGRSQQRARRHRNMWWVVNGIVVIGTSAWLAGALGIIGRAGEGSVWEAKSWNEIYSRVPIIGKWL
ncbi:hypothetical protein PHISCL_03195 [Aspergillus sclerotialis]|uniref:Mitochondrial adapter protein MCP1 transmembrane domain-containing protein n=1 Tax=Aspergillus sclerotialis TaxID=2070753 RepID=A0A3A2ZYK5_9EURO|nr:hypothetical protein PHISCL_03195 [Aspergillus sclerotialis]